MRTAGTRLPALDGYRGLAAVAVLTTHVGYMTGTSTDGRLAPVLSRLDIGVAIFFVLSGFLLFSPAVARWLDGRPPPSARRYLRHRAVRILPLYWATLVLAAVAVRRQDDWTLEQTLVQAGLLQSFRPQDQTLGLTQMWSLSAEVVFYLALPLMGAALLRRHHSLRRVLAGIAALGLAGLAFRSAAATGLGPLDDQDSLQMFAHLDWFAAGMGLAVLRGAAERDRAAPGGRLAEALAVLPGWCLVGALSLFAIATTPLAGPRQLTPPTGMENLAKHVLYLGVAVLLVLPVVLARDSWLHRALSTAPLLRLGELSYGIFCLHLVVLEVLFDLSDLELFSGRLWAVWPSALLLSVAAAWLARQLIERPTARLRGGAGPEAPRATRPPTPAPTGPAAR
jgi:peptidoglycan/LPS O-acetylase OafA/YrhL